MTWWQNYLSGDWWKALFVRFNSRRTGGALCIEISIKEQARCRKSREVDQKFFDEENQ